MCGIAGMIDLAGRRPVPAGVLRRMADAIFHRGPDEDGYLEQPGVGLANRRLGIVGLFDGRQPISNEDGTVSVVYNGELFDYREKKKLLEDRGHHFRTHCDTELLPHLWEEHGEGMFAHLRGQFAVALWDRRRQTLVLGRDRFGICPLFWTRQGDWLLFASEIKGLLASGLVDPRPDPRGLNQLFTFFALPGPVTCFEGIQLLQPGHFLRVRRNLANATDRPTLGEAAELSEHVYWRIDFPEQGQEDPGENEKKLVDGFEEVMVAAVERRLRADVPVVSYLSGGVDSTTVVALAAHVRKAPIPTFTIAIDDPTLNEVPEATLAARHIGVEPTVVRCGAREILDHYPELIRAAEGPVVDTSCTALMLLAKEVHRQGYKVTLTGEGSDEWLGGYPWYKVDKVLRAFDVLPGVPLSRWIRRGIVKLAPRPHLPWEHVLRSQEAVGGHTAWHDMYGLMAMNKVRFYTPAMWDAVRDHVPYADLLPDVDRVRRWHPLNRALWIGIRGHLPGLLLNAKGDRVAMNASVEARYPFLDEAVFDYLAPLHPKWKIRRLTEKYILRRLAERWLPHQIAWRRKLMFRAPFDSFHVDGAPEYVEQLLSPESLRRTGFFDPEAVASWRQRSRTMRARSLPRISVEMGLVGVLATQLWYQTYIDSTLADVPGSPLPVRPALAAG